MLQLFGVVSFVAFTPWKSSPEHSGEDNTFTFTIQKQNCVLSTSDKPVISVSIAGVSRDVLINSGSISNLRLISQDTTGTETSGAKDWVTALHKKRQRA